MGRGPMPEDSSEGLIKRLAKKLQSAWHVEMARFGRLLQAAYCGSPCKLTVRYVLLCSTATLTQREADLNSLGHPSSSIMQRLRKGLRHHDVLLEELRVITPPSDF